MPAPISLKDVIWEDSDVFLMARIAGEDGAYITQASITSITCYIQNLNTGTAPTPPSITVSDVVFDALQTDAIWTADSTGYNFKVQVADTFFAEGDTKYLVEFRFTSASTPDFKFPVQYFLITKRVYGS